RRTNSKPVQSCGFWGRHWRVAARTKRSVWSVSCRPGGRIMIYQFRKGFSIRNVEAQIVGDELYRIRNANDGKLRPEDVVQWAAELDSPIHACFTWGSEQAAHLFRLQEARVL